MFLEELSVLNFRNLENQTLKFKNSIIVFFGNNGQGKTNLLEAIYLLSNGKSFRTRLDRELIAWKSSQARLAGKLENLEIDLIILENQKKLTINKQNKQLTDLIGSFIVVVFTPEDIDIISGSPDKKRRFLDKLLSSLDKKYLVELLNYNKILKRRNQTLFSLKNGNRADLWVWDKQLAASAGFLWQKRLEGVEILNSILKSLSKKVTRTEIKIVYKPPFESVIQKEITERYLKHLESTRNFDISRAVTTSGPHRDDFVVLEEEEREGKVVSKDLGVYGSRGEQKAAVLALKLAEIEVFEKVKKTRPVLILDEVLGELDRDHQELLLFQLRKLQSFVTTTMIESLEKLLGQNFEKFQVNAGKVTKV